MVNGGVITSNQLIIVTRYYPPIHNGLAHHSTYVAGLLNNDYKRVVVFCQKCDERIDSPPANPDTTVMEYTSIGNLYQLLGQELKRTPESQVLFQYVPHMWGRAGVAIIPALLPLWCRVLHRVNVTSFLHELQYDWSVKPDRLVLGMVHRVQLFAIALGSRALVVTNNVRYQFLRAKLWPFRSKVSRIPAGCISGRTDISPIWRSDGFYITWFGTLSFDQKLEELVQAFCSVAERCPGLSLVIAGSVNGQGERMNTICEYVKDFGVAHRVSIRGFVDEVELSNILRGSLANFHLATSGPSGRRTVVAAFLRSGKPLVAIRGHETDPEFHHGDNVCFVEPNAKSIGKTIVALWNDSNMRNQLSRGAAKLYQGIFSDDVIGEKLREVLAQENSPRVTSSADCGALRQGVKS